MKNPRFVTLVGMILVAAISRVIPHPWNWTPVAAMALFGGANFSNWRSAYLVPLAAMLLSDAVLGFYSMMPVTYLCFVATVWMGQQLGPNKSISRIAGTSIMASILFFVVTNFSCWLTMAEYSKNVNGFLLCYVRALPFFQWTLTGDLFFSAVMFGSLALSEKAFPSLRNDFQPVS